MKRRHDGILCMEGERRMRFFPALLLGKLLNLAINIIDKNRGSNFSGQWAMKLDPMMLKHFKGVDTSKVLFITGTNGKSTTNNLVNHILRQNGKTVVSNLEGANLIYGLATSLIKASNIFGKVRADFFVFETDERFLPLICEQLSAENLLITNLQKDQVQRNGDPDFIYRRIKNVVEGRGMRLFLNNEEPRAKSFDTYAKEVVSFGAGKHSESFKKNGSYVTMACPKCHRKITFEYYNNDGIGSFRCKNCGHSGSEKADYSVENTDFERRKFTLRGTEFRMPYDTPYMLYNYSAAVAVAEKFAGIAPEDAAKAFDTFKNVGGRFEILRYKGKTIKYMRIKQENPETLQTSINVMASDTERKMVCLGLCPLVDLIPHYANTFYAYDCDFGKLIKSDVERYFCFSERVCYDTANRLIYEGVDPSKIEVADTEDVETIFRQIENAQTDNIYLITWLHTYEHMEKYIKKEGGINE